MNITQLRRARRCCTHVCSVCRAIHYWDFLMRVSWDQTGSHECLMRLTKNSHETLMSDGHETFSWESHESLMRGLMRRWLSSNVGISAFSILSNLFSRTYHAFSWCLTSVSWGSHESLMSVSWDSHECIMRVSWESHECLISVSWVSHECLISVSWVNVRDIGLGLGLGLRLGLRL